MQILDGINELLRQWRRKLETLGMAARGMTARQIADFLTEKPKEEVLWRLDICEYMEREADKLWREGSVGTSELRNTARRSLQAYLGRQSVDINEVTTSLLNGWVQWLESRNGKGCRAASMYPSQLRAVFNKARREFNTDTVTRIPNDPFSRMERVRQGAPKPRSVTVGQLRAIAALPDRGLRFNQARDVFLLSFFLMGMNSVDFFNCPAVKDGRVTYERTKTRTRRDDKALISVAIPAEAVPLVEKYKGHRREYAFKFRERYSTRREFSAALNKGLKEVGEAVGVDGLQFYAARHTWATVAVNEAGVDKYTVHQALNHVDGKTAITDIYIRKSWEPLYKANRKVLDYVFGLEKSE